MRRKIILTGRGHQSFIVGDTVQRAARLQVVFREVNEQISKLSGPITETTYNVVVCECSDSGCAESIELTAGEYESVRADGTRFVILPGHQREGIERVVERHGGFVVVEKVGEAGEIAQDDDPRR
jgi:hypothetical protein